MAAGAAYIHGKPKCFTDACRFCQSDMYVASTCMAQTAIRNHGHLSKLYYIAMHVTLVQSLLCGTNMHVASSSIELLKAHTQLQRATDLQRAI